MDIQILSSGSVGNCYRVGDGSTSLLLECGLPIQKIKQGLNFNLSGIDACLVSHEHNDHSKSVSDIASAGIDVYMSHGTKKQIGIKSHRIKKIKAKKQFKIGTFVVLPFQTEHDAKEPLGFLIQSVATGDKLLFATDTYYVKYKFQGLTHIMVECNYALDILEENVKLGKVPIALKNRLLKSHYELENVKEFLRSNNLERVREIYLIHMSDGNSDEVRFKREIQEVTGLPVIVC